MSWEAGIAVVQTLDSHHELLLYRGLTTTLRHVNLDHVALGAREIAAGRLSRFRLALLPSGSISTLFLGEIEKFIHQGGKLLLGLDPPEAILSLLGLRRLKVKPLAVREM